jgi:hypothetical protein
MEEENEDLEKNGEGVKKKKMIIKGNFPLP